MAYFVMRAISIGPDLDMFEALYLDVYNREFWTYPGPHATPFYDLGLAKAISGQLNKEYRQDACYVVAGTLEELANSISSIHHGEGRVSYGIN